MAASSQFDPVAEAPLLPLAELGAEAEIVGRRRALGRYVPRWFLTLVGTRLSMIGTVMLLTIIVCAIFAPLIAHYGPTDTNSPLGIAPNWAHPFGTNDSGEDIFSQTVWGARFSLTVGAIAGVSITILAIAVGMFSGYVGGWVDDFLSMVMNVFLILPQLPLLIVIGAYIGLSGDQPVATALIMAGVITLTGWAWGGRVMRAQTLSLRSRDFVDAAAVTGESRLHIIFRDILPNMLSLIVNTVILSTAGAILTESAIDFLGIGSMTQVTWGTMLFSAEAGTTLFSHEWWCFVFPGLAIALTIMSMIFINNGVDTIANPRLRRIKAPKELRQASTEEPASATGSLEAAT